MPRVPPPEVVAAWPTPNLTSPETRGPTKTIITVILWVLVAAVLLLRLYTRRYISRRLGWDDILVTAAFFPATAFSVVGIVAEYEFGWDKHIWDLKVEWITKGLQLRLASFALFDIGTTLTKLSLLSLTHRLTPTDSLALRRFVSSLMVFNILAMLIYIILLLLQCRPLAGYWTLFPPPTPRNCLNEPRTHLIAGCWNTIMEATLVVLPTIIVLRSRSLPRRQMIVVTCLFAAGWLVVLVGAVRTYLLYVQTTAPDDDFTWLSWVSYLTSSVELYLGILYISIPATKPFFVRILPRLFYPRPCTLKPAFGDPEREDTSEDGYASPESLVPPPPPKDEKKFPDLNKPLPALAARNSEWVSERQSSMMVVDIPLRISLY